MPRSLTLSRWKQWTRPWAYCRNTKSGAISSCFSFQCPSPDSSNEQPAKKTVALQESECGARRSPWWSPCRRRFEIPKLEKNFSSGAIDGACRPLALFRQFRLHRKRPPPLDTHVQYLKRSRVGQPSRTQHKHRVYGCFVLTQTTLLGQSRQPQ